jgi:gliding motility-associated-like protein
MNRGLWLYTRLLLLNSCIFLSLIGFAQCPPNIGFETGTFSGWECSAGSISSTDGVITLSSTNPSNGRHTIIASSDTYPMYDFYGGFPVSCPNGSGYSIQLGNNGTGRQAESMSYTFTIPADVNNYSIIYNYAVVFQNPGHNDWEQPKFTAKVYDVTNASYIGCSSFEYAASGNLPGFTESGVKDSVFVKSWTPVTIKLSGYAGRTIRLEFTTNDCSRGGHFGYAYVDVNDNCESPISGSIQCNNDTAQTLIAPYGFSGYRWFNSDFTKLLGTDISLHFAPPPPPNTVYAVEVIPYLDQGCIDTVYATIQYSGETINLQIPGNPVPGCETNGIDLGSNKIIGGSSAGLKLSFYTDPSQTNYVPTPKFVTESGTYYVKATNSAGCVAIKPVTVNIFTPPDLKLNNNAKPVIRPLTFDLNTLILGNNNGVVFTFWKDATATIPLQGPEAITHSGTYYIKGTNEGGCSVIEPVTVYVNEPPVNPPNVFSPNGDGVHDFWEIPILSIYPDCVVEIYNRPGQLIYRSAGTYKPWDGKYKGVTQPVATYYFVIRPAPELPAVGGSVTIVR